MRIRGRLAAAEERMVDVVIDGDRIQAVEAATGVAELGGDDWLIAPAFCDLQVNGYGGLDFNSGFWTSQPADPANVAKIADKLAAAGTGLFLPTIVTHAVARLKEGLSAIDAACEQDPAMRRTVPGIHLEGPFLSPEDGPRGAHPLESIKDPDWDLFRELQDAAGGRIKILTVAPERPGALALIEKAVESGVVISIGHSGAQPEDIHQAVAAGATLSTHLGNGAHAMIPRHPNYIWEQLASDELTACIISDLQHLPAALLKCFTRIKPKDRLLVVSDCVALGGLPAGIYDEGRHEVLPSGRVNLAGTPYLAGAGHLLDTCLANLYRETDYTAAEAVDAVTLRPAEAIGIADRTGRLEAGYDANLTCFRWTDAGPLEVGLTVVGGEVRYQA